ncbi:(Fe-S)-binding protein [Streptomyces sp. Tue 6430]|nr:(Fe-S)-binding protein [Streptomyces sp. Tue 6430]
MTDHETVDSTGPCGPSGAGCAGGACGPAPTAPAAPAPAAPAAPGPEPGRGPGIFDKDLLDRCISCGFCLPACPTYALTGEETSSPRGRITLMRALEAGDLGPDDPTLAEESSFCLGCRACETVCPAGVEYGQLLEQWRDHQWSGRNRPWIARALMMLVSRPGLLRLQGLVRRHARGPGRKDEPGRTEPDRTEPDRRPQPKPVGQPSAQPVSLMLGCVERGLYPQVSRAVRQLCPDVDVPARQGCCGALHAHNGDSETGAELARTLGEQLPGTILTTAGGCAAHIAHHLGRDRVRELSEYLDDRGSGRPVRSRSTAAGRGPRSRTPATCATASA